MIFTFGTVAVNVSRADGTATIVREGQDDVILSFEDMVGMTDDDTIPTCSEAEIAEIALDIVELNEEGVPDSEVVVVFDITKD